MLRLHALCVGAVLFTCEAIDGRTAGQGATAPAFEVASVKANKLGPRSVQRAALQAGDRVTFTSVTLLTLIQSAYPPLWEISGGPAWVGKVGEPNFDADRFDVAALSQVEPMPVVGGNRNKVTGGDFDRKFLASFSFKPENSPA